MRSFDIKKVFEKSRFIFLAILLITLDVIGFFTITNENLAVKIVWILLSFLVAVIVVTYYLRTNKNLQRYTTNLSGRIGVGQTAALEHMPIGVLFLDKNKNIEWINDELLDDFDNQDILGKRINEVAPDLSQLIEENKDQKEAIEVEWIGKRFSIYVQNNGQSVYLFDLTGVEKYEDKYNKSKLFSGVITVDSYEEVVQDVSESEASQIRAFITSELGKWAEKFNIYLRRLSADRFIIFGREPELEELEKNRFKILDFFRLESPSENFPLTLSIGIAADIYDINTLSNVALRNLDLALGRGGDQVVVRRGEEGQAKFFGGNSAPIEKRSRSRSRMIEKAFMDLVENSSNVIVAGHKNMDLDSLGAALGVYRLSRLKNKETQIIIEDKISEDLQRTIDYKLTEIDKLNETQDPEKKIPDPFVSMDNIRKFIKKDSLLVLVDHSRPTRTSSEKTLSELQNRIVVIDHHRVADEEFPEKPLLFFVEQYASSTSEMVAELLQFEDLRKVKLTNAESTALLSGIELDTKGFVQNTGARTFDAASFLRAHGANIKFIQSLNKTTSDDVVEQATLTSRVEILNNIAISMGDNGKVYDSVVTAKTADGLLSIKGIDASFVIAKRQDGKFGINARSNGKVNVQVIMEEIGGGGSLENAAAQVETANIFDALNILKEAINKVISEEK